MVGKAINGNVTFVRKLNFGTTMRHLNMRRFAKRILILVHDPFGKRFIHKTTENTGDTSI